MPRKGAGPFGFGAHVTADYDELIDHPVEMGEFALASFRACGVVHDIVITGRHRADLARLRRDLKRLCEEHIRFFGEPTPMKRFLSLVTAVGEGYGGLEHRASTALLCSHDNFQRQAQTQGTVPYPTFLGLARNHDFHTLNF